MRTLYQIRRNNNNNHELLFTGMENRPLNLPSELQQNEKETLERFVKPISRRVLSRYIDKTK